ncbi:MAG: putative Death-on-curing family protein [uncultured bacterium]|nr:MAG: putative Death-on-curing family protein [uncultured bacterium]
MRYLTIAEVEYVAHALAMELMLWDEPIPDFNTRFPSKLEVCLKSPLHTFGQKDLYPGMQNKAAILFYLMIKDHPFQNGNKRIAVMTLLTLLYKNNRWLNIDNQQLYNFARWVAESDPTFKTQVVSAITELIRKYSTPL